MRALAQVASTLVLICASTMFSSGCTETGPAATIPEGTVITVSLYSTTRSDRIQPGDHLVARVEREIFVDDVAALDQGDLVALEVLDARAADPEGPARLRLELVSLEFPNGGTRISTRPVEFRSAIREPGPVLIGPLVDPGADLVVLPTKSSALVLLAGQHMRFTMMEPAEIALHP